MAVLEILQIGDPVLRKRSSKITHFDVALRQLADDMIETMHEASGVGLAAPQIGVNKRLIVVEMPDDPDYPNPGQQWVICNPDVVKVSRTTEVGQEGCLSVAGYVGWVARPDWAIIRGQDLHGHKVQVKTKEFLARAFMHEIDHLNGVLYVDVAEEGTVITAEEWEARLRAAAEAAQEEQQEEQQEQEEWLDPAEAVPPRC